MKNTLKHVLILGRAKHHSFFPYDKDFLLDPSMFEEWKRNIFSFVEEIFLVPDEGFYYWIIGGEVQIVWT